MMKWDKIYLDRFWLGALVIILISISLISSSCSCDKTETINESPISFDTGKTTKLVSQTIGTGGGIITVDKPGDPLDGLSIEVPQGAYDSAVSFTISEREILNFETNEKVVALSPLISIDNGNKVAEQLIEVSLPVSVPEGYFAMAFFYNEETGDFEGLPTVHDNNTLTFVTTHFSEATYLGVPTESLEDRPAFTAFIPSDDNWRIPNICTYLAPGGYCRGMNLTSLYYLEYKKYSPLEKGIIKVKRLSKYGNYGNGLCPEMDTLDFGLDDKWAIQLCSVAQNLAADDEKFDLMVKNLEFWKAESPGRTMTIDQINFYHIAVGLWLHEPQLLYVLGKEDGKQIGHSLICIGKKDGQLEVVDPNFPELVNNRIDYDFNKRTFSPYIWPDGTKFDHVGFAGSTYFFDLTALDALWKEYEAEGTGRYFPAYDILVTEYDAKGNEGSSYILNRTDGLSTSAKYLKFTLSAPYEGKITLYRYEDRNNPLSTGDKIELKQGENILGFHLHSKAPAGNWVWAGFDWVKITYEEKETTTTTQSPKVNKINFTLEPSSATIKVDERIIIKTASNVAFSKVPITWETITQGTSTEFPFSTARMDGVTDPDGWKVNRSWGKPGTYTVTFIAYEWAFRLDDKDRIEYGRATATITVVPK